ncbi:MAG: prolipoprotein diacylglyceryl transferase [Terriglobales bacterium]
MFPVLLNFGDFTLHTYGLLVAIGYLSGIYVARHYARRFGLDPDKIFNLAVYLALAAIVGAKLFLVIQGFHFYVREPAALFSVGFLESAGIFYGGLLGALLVLTLYVHRQKLRWLAVGDAIVPGVAVGQSIGRLGCFSAGCCWGKATTGFFGYTFHNAYAHATVGVPLGVRLYPTQLLMSAGEFVIFLVLWRVAKRRAFEGQIMALYLLCYGVFRFLIDFLRYYEPSAMLFGGLMTDAQFTSLCLIALAVIIWAVRGRRAVASATAA